MAPKAKPAKTPSKAQIEHGLPISPGRYAKLPDETEHTKLSLDKHAESLRYDASYLAKAIQQELRTIIKRRDKKDDARLKSLVWSFGVLFDKVASGSGGEAVSIRIPAKLLENVKAILAVQVSKKDAPRPPTPDALSGTDVIESTAYDVVVAPAVANSVPRLDNPSANEPGATLATDPPGGFSSGTGTDR